MLEGLDTSPEQAAEAEVWEISRGNLLLKTDRAKYEYDRRGRRVSKVEAGNRTDYVWDARDRLREVVLPSQERVIFTYDAFGRRTRKDVRDQYDDRRYTVEFLWDGDVLAGDTDGRHGYRCFVHAPGTFVPLLQAEQGEVFSYVVDQVGVPKELIDSKGRVAWSAAHSAWGRIIEMFVSSERASHGQWAIESPFRLLGQYADEETSLCYARFRYFDATVGRWCSPDPLGVDGGVNLNGFNACPTTSVDPYGLEPQLIDPSTINFSQRTVGDQVDRYTEDMASGAWDWSRSGPLRAMEVNGQLVSYDNRRLMAAQNAGLTEVPVEVVNPNDTMPGSKKTWDRAFDIRRNDVRNIREGGPVPPEGLRQQPRVCSG